MRPTFKMSFYNLYVGDASDPTFHWDGGDFSGNIPEIIHMLEHWQQAAFVVAVTRRKSPRLP